MVDEGRIEPGSLALAGGLLTAAGMFIVTWMSIATGYMREILELIGTAYIGYTITPVGSIIGAVLGFIDAYAGLYLLAWIYNRLNLTG
ncbi:MAG: hypothetical protein GF416_07120 [Candidatus Altiarchaeales archaeon]|nr:hypothetical protein [Candidatus Altiarchaeales archaeon]MBD3416883.1 hypothetical protein [Candidatus Altiarchaeales archaeon]